MSQTFVMENPAAVANAAGRAAKASVLAYMNYMAKDDLTAGEVGFAVDSAVRQAMSGGLAHELRKQFHQLTGAPLPLTKKAPPTPKSPVQSVSKSPPPGWNEAAPKTPVPDRSPVPGDLPATETVRVKAPPASLQPPPLQGPPSPPSPKSKVPCQTLAKPVPPRPPPPPVEGLIAARQESAKAGSGVVVSH